MNNIVVDKSVLNHIHARDFFPAGDAEKYRGVVKNLKFEPSQYGWEIPQFGMIFPDLDVLLGKMVGDFLEVDEDRSGVFRHSFHEVVHFEEFDSLFEWRLAVALEDNVFRTYHHKDGYRNVLEAREDDKWKELEYRNPEHWELETQIRLKANDAIFYRPWVFHSFQFALLNCYTLMLEKP